MEMMVLTVMSRMDRVSGGVVSPSLKFNMVQYRILQCRNGQWLTNRTYLFHTITILVMSIQKC